MYSAPMLLFVLYYIVPFIVLTALVEVEFFGWATISLIVVSVVAGYFHWGEIIPYVRSHALQCGLYASGYIVLGVLWTFVKWLLFLMKFNTAFKENRARFLRSHNLPADQPIPVGMMKDFRDIARQDYRLRNLLSVSTVRLERPQALDNKKRIVYWGSFWPCSVIGFVLNDPVRAIFTHLFNMFSGSYQWLSDKIVSAEEFTDRPLPPPPTPEERTSADRANQD